MPYPTRFSDPVAVSRCLTRASDDRRLVEVRGAGIVARGVLDVSGGGMNFVPAWPVQVPRAWTPVEVECAVEGASVAFPTRLLPKGAPGSWRIQWPTGVQLAERRRDQRVLIDGDAAFGLRVDSHPERPLLRLHDLSRSGLGLILESDTYGLAPDQALDATLILPGEHELRLRLRTIGEWRAQRGRAERVLGATVVLVDRQHQAVLDEVIDGMLPQRLEPR